MNNAVFGKTMENVSKHSDKKLLTTERRRSYLVSEPKHNFTKFFPEYLLTIEMKKTQILMNKLVYLGLSILELSKLKLMYEFWYDGEKKICCMDTDSVIVCIKTNDIYKDIEKDGETKTDT